ncbi:hypothetical protein FACS1894152_8620 [Bacilli bacterium]|nr:hypothetical protein FACS1894152_8620 [Bacilli bacterium]
MFSKGRTPATTGVLNSPTGKLYQDYGKNQEENIEIGHSFKSMRELMPKLVDKITKNRYNFKNNICEVNCGNIK